MTRDLLLPVGEEVLRFAHFPLSLFTGSALLRVQVSGALQLHRDEVSPGLKVLDFEIKLSTRQVLILFDALSAARP